MPTNYTTQQAGVITLMDENGDLRGIIVKDVKTHKNIFYTCTEMDFDTLQDLFKADKKI